VRTALSLAAVLAAAALWACGDEPDRLPGRSDGTPARIEAPPAERTRARLLALEPLNESGVRGVARLLVDGKRLAVAATVTGASPRRVHMQHIHVPDGDAEGRCPTAALDADGDGVVSLEEGAPAYGAPAVSLEPFPKPDGPAFDYASTLAAPRGLELDRAVVVLHGRSVRGEYDPLLPVACGEIEEAEVREVVLDPVNDSTVAGTARLARAGDELLAWLSLGGPIGGREHMQHIHLPEGGAAGSCPTLEQDEDGDGIVSLEEGAPAYGTPAVSLEPFPQPRATVFQYAQRLRVDEALPLDRGVIVVHGMDVGGAYDPTVPVACGAIDPTLPRAGHAGGGSAGVGAYGP
jgi:hypothetical protein